MLHTYRIHTNILILTCNVFTGEMCQVIECGFPLLSDTVAAYPDILPNKAVKGVKVSDFLKHLRCVLFSFS